MNSVMISIKPEWCALIASGEKTAEVRKTKPSGVKLGKLAEPFKCYIYETQGKSDMPWLDEDGHMIFRGRGKVVAEFLCDGIYPICYTMDGFADAVDCRTTRLKPKDFFLDANPLNVVPENMVCVPQKVHARMAKNRWFFLEPELTRAAIKWCEHLVAIKDFEKGGHP